jgi:hypothetical protein
MKFYRLYPINASFFDKYPSFKQSQTWSAIVVADTERTARVVAAEAGGEAWLDNRETNCEEIDPYDYEAPCLIMDEPAWGKPVRSKPSRWEGAKDSLLNFIGNVIVLLPFTIGLLVCGFFIYALAKGAAISFAESKMKLGVFCSLLVAVLGYGAYWLATNAVEELKTELRAHK